jgi:hypothetical protein
LNNIKISKNIRLIKSNNSYSIPNINFQELELNEIVDKRKKYPLDNISSSTNEDTTLVIQPSLENELNLETNMFSVYPDSNIPFSYSNSWIGM